MHLARFPRVHLAHLPTPLEPMERLSKHLGGPKLWIKRDDCTGLSTGGNKTRKLEFLMGEAVRNGADTIITQGATQSNHARQTAAAAARLGMECHILLENRTGFEANAHTLSGNVLLDMLHGASISKRSLGADMNSEMASLATDLGRKGRKPYVIPGGGSNPVGATGYANCALELVSQANEMQLRIDHIVQATGSAGTQAGLVAGLCAINANIPVYGISVRAPKANQEASVFALAQATAEFVGAPGVVKREHVVANSDYVGQGYGLPTEGMVAAVKLVAKLEGILLDPVYTGKGMAGMIDLVRKNQLREKFKHCVSAHGRFCRPVRLS